MKIAVVQFPGSNCERETMLAIKRAGMTPIEFMWNEPVEKLQEMQGYIVVGGFSYEDRSRAGIIAALDPVMKAIEQQSQLGKPVLGICNGAQILVETGLVPGLENNKIAMVLTENKRIAHGKLLGVGYYNAWINMRLSDNYQRNAFTNSLTPKDILHVPIAHGEGRFVMTEALIEEIVAQGLHVFQYCDEQGDIADHFPVNPNGSVLNIAAITNKAGNVMAMMPHPERTKNGDAIFQSMRHYIEKGLSKSVHHKAVTPLYYYPRPYALPVYRHDNGHHVLLTELMITDNQALTVQNTLKQLGLPVKVRRYDHWEIVSEAAAAEEIKGSGVLFNPRKEKDRSADRKAMIDSKEKNEQIDLILLVVSKENIHGINKLQAIKDHFDINSVSAIRYGVLWRFTSDGTDRKDLLDRIIHSHIIFNPYAHDCYQYSIQSS